MRPLVVVGLAWGDESKGSIVDAIVRKFGLSTVIRFNGGGNAAHHVYTDDGRHHAFSQFGSGTFVPGVKTFLSRHVLIEPGAILNEAEALAKVGVTDAIERLTIDGRCLVVTPYHMLANRLLSKGLSNSCGKGIGETVRDSIEYPHSAARVSDFINIGLAAKALSGAYQRMAHRYPQLCADLDAIDLSQTAMRLRDAIGRCKIASVNDAKQILTSDGLIFEGAQGTLLDEDFGVHPHTTWSRTTNANAMSLLREAGNEAAPMTIGVIRTFMTRHGAGAFPTEDESFRKYAQDDDNTTGEYQGKFRVGAFDWTLFHYAKACNGLIDAVALTHRDKFPNFCAGGDLLKISSYGKKASDKEIKLSL